MSLLEEMTQLAQRAKEASRALARLTTEEKNRCLMAMAEALEKNGDGIRRENEKDMKAGAESGLSGAMLLQLAHSVKFGGVRSCIGGGGFGARGR